MARDLSGHWKRLIAGGLVVLAAGFALPLAVKPPYLDENRTLAERPPWPKDLKGWQGLPHAVDLYVADRFPARAHLIGALNFLRLKVGTSGSSRVIVGRDGWLFYDGGSHLASTPMTADQTRAWLEGLAGRTETLRAQGIAYLTVVPPMKEAVYPQHAPAWFSLDPNRAAVRLARLAAAAQAGDVLYLAPVMARPAAWGMKLYAPYETHWTGLGAYQGYAALMRRLQALGLAEGPRPLEAFTDVPRGSPYTPRNLALMLGVASFVDPDFPQVRDPAAEAALHVIYLTADTDWTKPHVIDTGQAGKPVLMMTMDSFSTALLPFLYGHFSRIVLAHNQDGPWREDLIARFHPNIVLEEVVESGLPFVMDPSPPASPEAKARIAAALAPPRPPRPPTPKAGLTLRGDITDDRLVGGEAADRIVGGGGDDTLEGRGGRDVIRGGKGDDRLDGGDGDDWLSGDRGNDTLTGGKGGDVFHFSADGGQDAVTDFAVFDGDRVEIDRGTPFTLRQAGADTVVEVGTARLTLKGVKAADLPPGAVVYR